MRTGVMAGGYVQVDETPIRYLDPGHGKARQGYLWAYSRPGGDVLFDWRTRRAAVCLDNVITADFTGTLQCDGYSAYPAFAERRAGKVTLAGCCAHARRKFHEALDQTPRTAGWILRQIAHLYRVEKDLREKHAGPCLRLANRAHQSRPIIVRLHRALIALKFSRRPLPQSLLGQAIDYTLSQWPALGLYLEDGRIEIDNNLVENAIRPTEVAEGNRAAGGRASSHRQEKLALHRRRASRPARSHPLHDHRKLPPSRNPSPRLPARRPHPPPAPHQLADQGHHPASLGQS